MLSGNRGEPCRLKGSEARHCEGPRKVHPDTARPLKIVRVRNSRRLVFCIGLAQTYPFTVPACSKKPPAPAGPQVSGIFGLAGFLLSKRGMCGNEWNRISR